MKFEIQMPRRHRSLGISNNSSTPRRFFCFFLYSTTANKTELIFSSIEERNLSICDIIPCSLLHPRNFYDCRPLIFFMKRNRFCSFTLRCECIYYISIRLSAIGIVDYLFLSTKCSNRGRLIWNSHASPIYNVLNANTKYTRSTRHLNPEIYM